MPDVTPVRRQYLQIKAQHPDAIVFFRLGDFYETFDEDAEIAARELDLVLTSRPISKSQRVPMAGVPYHAVQGYIARLIEKGYRVAIAEQVGEVTGKGLVDREVTRIVTPGTIVEPELLEEKRSNYLIGVVIDEERAGLAYVDITTGEFATTELEGSSLSEELSRLQPRECIVPATDTPGKVPDEVIARAVPPEVHVTPLPTYRFELGAARQALLDHLEAATLEGFGCAGKPLAIRAAGAIIYYLGETQKGALGHVTGLTTYSTAHFMALDAATRRNLELTETIRERKQRGSLLDVLDATRTPMGGRLLRTWLHRPSLRQAEIEERLDRVQAFYEDTVLRGRVREALKQAADLERLANRVSSGIATPRDLIAIRDTLVLIPELRRLLSEPALSPTSPEPSTGMEDHRTSLHPLIAALSPNQDVADLITSAIADDPPTNTTEGGIIRRGFSSELDSVITAARDAKAWVADLEREERNRTGIKSLKVGYNKVFGYYIEVTKANLSGVPGHYIRKQTLVNAERYITPELKEAEALILNAEERQIEIEGRLFKEVCQVISAQTEAMLRTARTLARLDVFAALAEVAVRNRYTRPQFTEKDQLEIVAGRHPVVEKMLQSEPFTPNDLILNADRRILIITGPNMAGKSVYLRQNALIVLMAQIGSFVPAERAQMSVVDRIFTRIGAQDEVSSGQSTFMVEMVETANILNHASPRSLLILDEIGRGTSTYDGLSIAWAVVEYLHNHPERRARTLFATHYHELIEIADRLPAVANCSLAVVEEGDQVVFLHKVVEGGADRSYGIHVARLAGVPRPVIHRAEEVLTDLESGNLRPGTATPQPYQPILFAQEHPVVDALRKLDVSAMTPLDAINTLYKLQKETQQSSERKQSRK
ncbi:MAG: DNA mismatch repair protein MutS [Chloroflexi bacterium]|nr:DNA mismatch repair protein MutS [Chloroflexota bacterium]